jgi:hypothetical protein
MRWARCRRRRCGRCTGTFIADRGRRRHSRGRAVSTAPPLRQGRQRLGLSGEVGRFAPPARPGEWPQSRSRLRRAQLGENRHVDGPASTISLLDLLCEFLAGVIAGTGAVGLPDPSRSSGQALGGFLPVNVRWASPPLTNGWTPAAAGALSRADFDPSPSAFKTRVRRARVT